MRTLLLTVVCLVLAAPAALAQPGASGERPRWSRVGLELGVGLQGGEIACSSEGDFCDGFTEAGGLNLSASYFTRPGFGITLDLWGMSHVEDDFTISHYVNTVGVKWRPLRILTLTGGLGVAHATLDYNNVVQVSATSDDGFAILGAVALDVIRARRWALSVEARVGKGFYGDDNNNGTVDVVARNSGLGVGFAIFGF